jgi:hypothetical protein
VPRRALLALLAACGGSGATAPDAAAPDAAELPPIPDDAIPCEAPEHWPLAATSKDLPLHVHHRPGEEAMAAEVLELLETAWAVEVDQLGFSPPPPDDGACGPDAGFDVFLWRGLQVSYVDAFADVEATPHDDQLVYMALDPWGPYGGELLDVTVAHELNHALQAADDWYDAEIVYEMTAVFVEDLVFDDDDGYLEQLIDFQASPDWSLDRNDDYATWYMYGAALYLRYLRDRHFAGSGAFAARMWSGLRGADVDFEDALDDLLPVTFLDSAVEFAAWRWFTGARDDGAHFEEGASFPEVATVATLDALPADVPVEVMALGSAYVSIPAGGVEPSQISLEGAAAGVEWVTQVIDGGRAVVITALPLPENADPADRTDAMFAATLRVAP